MRSVILAGCAMAASPALAEEPMICGFAQKRECAPGKECRQLDPEKVFLELDVDRKVYGRCGDDGCDRYAMNVSGEPQHYRSFEVPGRGLFAKVGPSGDVVEIATIGPVALVAHGQCFPKSQVAK